MFYKASILFENTYIYYKGLNQITSICVQIPRQLHHQMLLEEMKFVLFYKLIDDFFRQILP